MSLSENIKEKEKEFKELYVKYQEIEEKYSQNKEINSNKEKYVATFHKLKTTVRDLEELRQEYDMEIGFSSAQYTTHDLVFKFKTSKKGHVKMEVLMEKAHMINSILDIIHPGSEVIADFEILGVAAGSSQLYADYQAKSETIEPQKAESIQTQLHSVFEASEEFVERKAPIEEKLAEFHNKTGLEPEQSVKVLSIITNNLPTKNEEDPLVGLSLGGDSVGTGKIFDLRNNEMRRKFNKATADVKDYLRVPEPEFFSGQLRQLEEWESAHKFILFDIENNSQCTIHYEPNSANMVTIKDNIGKMVTVKRIKEGNSWYLGSWENE